MAWRVALLIPTCNAISFTRLAPERDLSAEADRAVVGAPLQMVDFDGHDLAEADSDVVGAPLQLVDFDGRDLEVNKNVALIESEPEQHQPLLSDYMAETNDTASDTQPVAGKEAKLLLDDYVNESDAIASEPQPVASEVSEEARVAAGEAHREASEASEQTIATASESRPASLGTTAEKDKLNDSAHDLIESEQHLPRLDDYMVETNDTRSDTQPTASEEAKLLLDDYINESDAIASEPQPAAGEVSEEARVAAWEAQREASEASESRPASLRATAEKDKLNDSAEEECEEAEPESTCRDAVDWLRQSGFSDHPEWYPGYSSESTFDEVQAMLHGLGKASCPRPCLDATGARMPDACQDVVEGSRCYDAIDWLKSSGLEKHPGWYPDLKPGSSAAEIQAELFHLGKADCPAPCFLVRRERKAAAARRAKVKAGVVPAASSDHCLDAEPDTTCHTAVTYGLNEGIRKHPTMYEGLTTLSSFQAVQYYLYLNNRSGCEMPCPESEVDLKTFNRPETLRVKKRVEDMSVKELGDFFNGKWDGYVTQIVHGDWNPSTTSLQERQWVPTTTVPIEQQPLPQVDDDSNDVELEAIKPATVTLEPAINATVFEDVAASQEMANASATELPVTEPTSKETEEMANATPEQMANATAEEMANATFEEMANATAEEMANATPEEMANATPEEMVNATPEEMATNGTAETANISTEVPQDGDIVAEATPEIAAEATPEIANVSTELPQDGGIVNEATPMVDTDGHNEGTTPYQEPREQARETSYEEPREQAREIVDEPTPMVDTYGHDEGMTSYEEPRQETREEIEQKIRKQLMEEMQLQTTTTAAPQETEEEMRRRIKAELMKEIIQSKGQ